MNKYTFSKRPITAACLLITGIACLLLSSSFSPKQKKLQAETGNLKITFINTANGKPIRLRDSLYSNYFGEQYSISKLKYYISNITMTANNSANNLGGYYLMNAATEENSLELSLQPGDYSNLEFLLGVDSIRNCSGAQTGALDPMNDMFWTWSSGYVIFKIEGTSPASTADLQRIEHHIGGYKGANNVSTRISFPLTAAHPLQIKANSTTEVFIETNLDNFWHGNADIKISELPACTIAGAEARKVATNFKNMFSIKDIQIKP